MQRFLAPNIPTIILIMSFALIASLLKYWEWSTKRSRKRSHLTQDLLRGPGESLREKVEDMTRDIVALMMVSLFLPLVFYSIFMSGFIFNKVASNIIYYLAGIIWLIIVGYPLYKIYRLLKLRRQYVLGWEAEVAVGQELNLLMRKGYWVFHDFPANKFNIDHIVIGPNGVFAVETKGRPKRTDTTGKTDAQVSFDGTKLTFPNWSETSPINQAQRQAQWLQDWLSKATGADVLVQPVLALPGWFIKRTKQGGLPVINGKTPEKFFEKFGTQIMSEQSINQVVHQIDQKCRTIGPRSYVAPTS